MRKKLLELFGGGSKISPTITKVDPFVPKNKKEISARDLRRARQKRKTSEVNLDNTIFRIKQETDKLKKMKTEKKAKGGRVGLKRGTPKPQTNVEKIKKTFGPKTKIKFDAKKSDLDKSGDLSKYEKARGMAIAKAMAKRKKKV
jgi:hypothetical protein